MSVYFIGTILVLIATLAHAGANVIDSNLANRVFKRLSSLILISEVISLLFLPIIILVNLPSLIDLKIGLIIFACATIDVFYLFPYYWSFRNADTSIVTSLFSLGKIFVPILAFFVVSERLGFIQYFGLFLVIVASVALTIEKGRHVVNKAFWLMLGVSLMMAVESVLYKFVFEQGTSWGTVVFWLTIFKLIIAAGFMLSRENRTDLTESLSKARTIAPVLLLEEVLSWMGSATFTLAISLIPVSIVEGVGEVQAIFVLLLALVLNKKYPQAFREQTERSNLSKKFWLFVVIILGTVLMIVII